MEERVEEGALDIFLEMKFLGVSVLGARPGREGREGR
jgi:hypothetical protein